MKIQLKISDINNVLKSMSREADKANAEALFNILKRTHQPLLSSIQSKVPVRTGKLKNSYKFKKLKAVKDFALASVGSTEFWSKFVEFGHRIGQKGKRLDVKKDNTISQGYVEARPHVRPAFDETNSQIKSAIKNELKKELAK